MPRHLRLMLALAVVFALALGGTASAAKSVTTITPKRPGPNTIVTVTVKNPAVKRAFKAGGKLYAELTPPPAVPDADGNLDGCNIHHPPQGQYRSAGTTAVFRMVPGDALAGPGHWCAGTWKVRLYAMLDGFADNTDSGHIEITLARTSFVAHA
jgi:hypothetical protein